MLVQGEGNDSGQYISLDVIGSFSMEHHRHVKRRFSTGKVRRVEIVQWTVVSDDGWRTDQIIEVQPAVAIDIPARSKTGAGYFPFQVIAGATLGIFIAWLWLTIGGV